MTRFFGISKKKPSRKVFQLSERDILFQTTVMKMKRKQIEATFTMRPAWLDFS